MRQDLAFISGSFIALAWPRTQVVKEGKWYDTITELLGFIKNDKYTVGHAALMLVNHLTGTIYYYDFGRYHTPYQYGRVRGETTDPELRIYTKAIVKNGEVQNLDEILADISQNSANHGDGIMFASIYHNIDFQQADNSVQHFQKLGVIPYSPLNTESTNCSRFVAHIAISSKVNTWQKIALKTPYTFSPSPRSNIRIIGNENSYYTVENGIVNKYEKSFLSLFNMFQTKLYPTKVVAL